MTGPCKHCLPDAEQEVETRLTHLSVWAVDSHPMDSRIVLMKDAFPSVTVKIAKGSADGPLVLIENDESLLHEAVTLAVHKG